MSDQSDAVGLAGEHPEASGDGGPGSGSRGGHNIDTSYPRSIEGILRIISLVRI